MAKTDMAVIWDFPVALALLTRLPLPRLPDAAFAVQARAVWAFPLVGLVIGALAGGAGWAALALGLPPWGAAGLALTAQILLTGAMHEDGLADSADGLWGGQTRARRLEIMKDSAIGSYGVLALILSAGLRWGALAALLPIGIGPMIAAAALSRAALPCLMRLPNARGAGLSHHVGRPGGTACLLALGLGAALALIAAGPAVLIPGLCAAGALAGLAALAIARIGGQTGDILGAGQQVAETLLLLGLAAALTPPS